MSFDHTPVSFELTIFKEYFAHFFLPVEFSTKGSVQVILFYIRETKNQIAL